VLGLLSAEGLIRLEQVVQDGTKIKAQAASDSFQGAARIEEHLERARRRVREMGEPDQEARPDGAEQARRRARRERQQRLEQALEELQTLRPHKPRARVSVTEPEARRMRQADGAFAPNYNVQISADAAQSLIVDVQVTQAANDSEQLAPAWDTNRSRCWPMAITPTAAASKPWRNWEWITSAVCAKAAMRKTAPVPDASPAKSSATIPSRTTMFVPEASTCAMQDDTNASRQFHLRGLAKVQTEMLWACLTYNFQQWIRLRKLQAALAAA
jgi:hypothetical protein